MNCKDIKNLLDEYISGETDDTDNAEIEAHIRICDDCRTEYNKLKALKAELASLAEPLPNGFEKRLLARLRHEKLIRLFRTGIPGVSAAAAIVLVCVIVIGSRGGYSYLDSSKSDALPQTVENSLQSRSPENEDIPSDKRNEKAMQNNNESKKNITAPAEASENSTVTSYDSSEESLAAPYDIPAKRDSSQDVVSDNTAGSSITSPDTTGKDGKKTDMPAPQVRQGSQNDNSAPTNDLMGAAAEPSSGDGTVSSQNSDTDIATEADAPITGAAGTENSFSYGTGNDKTDREDTAKELSASAKMRIDTPEMTETENDCNDIIFDEASAGSCDTDNELPAISSGDSASAAPALQGTADKYGYVQSDMIFTVNGDSLSEIAAKLEDMPQISFISREDNSIDIHCSGISPEDLSDILNKLGAERTRIDILPDTDSYNVSIRAV